MGPATIIVVAVGLAMDAFAVSIVSGSTCEQLKVKHAFRMALFFGGFQAFMPLVGSLAGLGLRVYIASYDHWVAFGLLSAVGGKMIYESFKIKPSRRGVDMSNVLLLLVLSVATSIDALAVGFTLSLVAGSILLAVTVIGLVTFVLSYVGVFIGERYGHFFESKIEAFGGLVLIAIAAKILVQDMFF
jgi:putative Mn2+ efflux pump MntP